MYALKIHSAFLKRKSLTAAGQNARDTVWGKSRGGEAALSTCTKLRRLASQLMFLNKDNPCSGNIAV